MNLREAFEAHIFRVRQPMWNAFAHLEIGVTSMPVLGDAAGGLALPRSAGLQILRGPWTTLRDVPVDDIGERQLLWTVADDPDFEPWTPPEDIERAKAWWPTYERGPVGWWFAMHGKNPDENDRYCTPERLRDAFAVWHAHPEPTARCICGHVLRIWDSPRRIDGMGEMACANPRCERWAKAHDDFFLTDDEMLLGVRDGVLRSEKNEDRGDG